MTVPPNYIFAPVPHAFSLLCNNTAIHEPMSRNLAKCTAMSKRNAFLHHYTVYGMEKDELVDAVNLVQDVMIDYRECEYDCVEGEDEEPME